MYTTTTTTTAAAAATALLVVLLPILLPWQPIFVLVKKTATCNRAAYGSDVKTKHR